ncbi:distal tail protein Dit [Bacillus thuringiensis]|uniref:Phage tail family protein n=1 Tax=Bacillus thuringiensis serovar andalousiensis TaxID=257985 RepID=A0A6H0TF57_BACTU|nr:distal tail protein Dit [Bacillus thuringiensis]QIW19059.1 phage tail family protein [Bacillus thuringiensis serovar andalousiensis]
MSSFTFNNQRKTFVQVEYGWKKPTWAPLRRNLLQVPNYPGARLLNTQTEIRVLSVPVGIIVPDGSDLETLKEEIADWLITDQEAELKFDSEPNRTYLAVVDDGFDPDEFITLGKGVIKFICPMPYKLGETKTSEFVQSWSTETTAYLTNKGSVEAPPIIEIEVKKPSTFLDVWFGEYPSNRDYFRIGSTLSINDNPVQEDERVLWTEMNTTVGWTDAVQIGSMKSTGRFKVNEGKFAFEVGEWGEQKNSEFTGPIWKRSIPGGPLTDFKAEICVTLIAKNYWEMGRVSMFLLDEQGDIVADVNMNDLYWTAKQTHAFARIGDVSQPNNTRKMFDSGGSGNTAFNDFYGRMAIARRGKKWSVYFARFRDGTEIDDYKAVEFFTDDEKNPMTVTGRRVAQIAIGIQRWSTSDPTNLMRIDDLKVWKINKVSDGSKPYLIDTGDKVVIDTERSLVTIDGKNAINVKDIFSEFPKIIRGHNRIDIMPPDVTAKVSFRERYR